MTDRFEELEEPKPRIAFSALAVAFVVGVLLIFRWSGSAPRQVVGVVQSVGTVSVAKIQGGTREEASVRLEDGNVVFASVVSGVPIARGEPRLLGKPAYQVVGRRSP